MCIGLIIIARFPLVDPLSSLPHELRIYILSLLDDHKDLLRASCVSHAWRKHAQESRVWRALFLARSGDGWRLIERYEDLWSKLALLRKAARSASATATHRPLLSTSRPFQHSRHLARLDPQWIDPSHSPLGRHSPPAPAPSSVERSEEKSQSSSTHAEYDEEGSGDAGSALSSSFVSAVELPKLSDGTFCTPNLPDDALLGRPDWQLVYAARHMLNTRWHQSNARPPPKSQTHLDEFKQRDHTQLPDPLPQLPEEYRHDALLRAQWRDRYWRENHSEHVERWLDGKLYMPGVRYLSGHTDSIYCVRFDNKAFKLPEDVVAALHDRYQAAPMYSPFESFGLGSRGKIVTGSRDKTIRIWDGDSGLCLYTLEGHAGSVLCLEYDDDVLLSGSSDMTVLVWDLKAMYSGHKPKIIHKLRGHRAGVLDLAMKDRWVISCGKDWTVRVYDRKNDFALVRIFQQHGQAVNAGSLSMFDGSIKAVTASGEGTILLWDVATGQSLKRFEGHTKGLACVKFVDNIVISGSNDWAVRVWDATTTRCLAELRGHWDLVRAICYIPRRNLVLTGGYDGAVKLFDVSAEVHADSVLPKDEEGQLLHWFHDQGMTLPPFEPHMARIFDVQMDGTRVVSCGESSRVCVRDFAEGCPLMRLFA